LDSVFLCLGDCGKPKNVEFKPKSILQRRPSFFLKVTSVLVNLLSERVEIEETVDKLGLNIDAKEWSELEEVLAETVEQDYRSVFGGSVEKLPRTEIVERWRGLLTPLKATQHIITNLHITIHGESADCAANVQAVHIQPSNTGDSHWTLGGRYDFQLVHDKGKWRISSIKLSLLWSTGNPQILGMISPKSLT
jgi:hypothetical protein